MRKLVLGPPGSGKTERLLREVEEALQRGIPPERIAYVSFTKAAVETARRRAAEWIGLPLASFENFRTVHSMCFRQLGLRKRDVFSQDSMKLLEERAGEELTGTFSMDVPTLDKIGDTMLYLDQFSRSVCKPLKECCSDLGVQINWYRIELFEKRYRELRQELGEVDFADMLEQYVSYGNPVDVDLAVVDEGQDLTRLQWRVVNKAFRNVQDLIVAGDDDQTIYHWAGADVRMLLDWDSEREVLGQSHRLPRRIYDLAVQIAGRIHRRYEKVWQPTDREGELNFITSLEEVDLSKGQWLLLARSRLQLKRLRDFARMQGVTYTTKGKSSVNPAHVQTIRHHEELRKLTPRLPIWHDADLGIPLEEREYLLSCRRRGDSLTAEPRVRIETIHGSKGMEADSVVLLSDLTRKVRRGMDIDPDSELRVQYVAVTRAKERLYVVTPTGKHAYYF